MGSFDKFWFDIRSFEKCAFWGKKTLFIQQSDFPAIFYVCPAILDGRNLLNLLAELFADRVHHVMAS